MNPASRLGKRFPALSALSVLTALGAVLLSCALSTHAASAPRDSAAAATAHPFVVIGYFPSWTGYEASQAPFSQVDILNYAFINATGAGGLTEANGPLLLELARKGHQAGRKVCVAIGGWNNGNTSEFEKMSARPKQRGRFVANVLEFLEANRLDGVDIDWEYPNAASTDNYAQLMSELGQALHAKGKLLSAAVIAKDDTIGRYIKPEVFAAIDYLNIMAYDWNWSDHAKPHSSFELADSALGYWSARGCPPAKLVLGVPFYGRYPETPYRELAGHSKEAPDLDSVASVKYNGRPTLRRKTELAWNKAGGLMIWELTQDTSDSTSLLTAIQEKIAALRGK